MQQLSFQHLPLFALLSTQLSVPPVFPAHDTGVDWMHFCDEQVHL